MSSLIINDINENTLIKSTLQNLILIYRTVLNSDFYYDKSIKDHKGLDETMLAIRDAAIKNKIQGFPGKDLSVMEPIKGGEPIIESIANILHERHKDKDFIDGSDVPHKLVLDNKHNMSNFFLSFLMRKNQVPGLQRPLVISKDNYNTMKELPLGFHIMNKDGHFFPFFHDSDKIYQIDNAHILLPYHLRSKDILYVDIRPEQIRNECGLHSYLMARFYLKYNINPFYLYCFDKSSKIPDDLRTILEFFKKNNINFAVILMMLEVQLYKIFRKKSSLI